MFKLCPRNHRSQNWLLNPFGGVYLSEGEGHAFESRRVRQ